MGMKLYIWHDVLCDYTCGMIVAMTENVEQARAVVLRQAKKRGEEWRYQYLADGIAGRPKVFRSPGAAWVSGGG